MKLFAATIMSLAFASPVLAEIDKYASPSERSRLMPTTNHIRAVSPAFEKYTNDALLGDVWKRAELAPRDRSIVTLAILITRNQTQDLRQYLILALENGVTAKELSEIVTHLAFYAGWGNAGSAAAVASDVFAERNIGVDQLPAASPDLLPLDVAAEAQRATRVEESAGAVSAGLVKYTGELLFRDLWLRPDLAPRDRSLVTVSALLASGQFAQIPFHLGKAMDNGLTKAEASEMLAHAAFYTGWPNAFSAVPVFKGVFEGRAK